MRRDGLCAFSPVCTDARYPLERDGCRSKSLEHLARLDVETSNELFDVLDQWGTYLKQSKVLDLGPRP